MFLAVVSLDISGFANDQVHWRDQPQISCGRSHHGLLCGSLTYGASVAATAPAAIIGGVCSDERLNATSLAGGYDTALQPLGWSTAFTLGLASEAQTAGAAYASIRRWVERGLQSVLPCDGPLCSASTVRTGGVFNSSSSGQLGYAAALDLFTINGTGVFRLPPLTGSGNVSSPPLRNGALAHVTAVGPDFNVSALVSFGGMSESGVLSNETQVLYLPTDDTGRSSWGTTSNPAGAWVTVSGSAGPQPGPVARHSHSFVPDSTPGSAWLFGGLTADGPSADLWRLAASGLVNVALRRPAALSSTFGAWLPADQLAAFATDGDTTPRHEGIPPPPSVMFQNGTGTVPLHTCAISVSTRGSLNDPLPYWSVDLGLAPAPITSITLHGDATNAATLADTRGYVIALSNVTGNYSAAVESGNLVVCYRDVDATGFGKSRVLGQLTHDCEGTARFVIVALPPLLISDGLPRQLRLCEVEVWQRQKWVWERVTAPGASEPAGAASSAGTATASSCPDEQLDLSSTYVTTSGGTLDGMGYTSRLVDDRFDPAEGGGAWSGAAPIDKITAAARSWAAGPPAPGCFEADGGTSLANGGSWIVINIGRSRSLTQIALMPANTTGVDSKMMVQLYGDDSSVGAEFFKRPAAAMVNCSLPPSLLRGWSPASPMDYTPVVLASCPADATARYVVIRRMNANNVNSFSLCEVRIRARVESWPSPRYGHAALSHRGHMWVFGGYGSSGVDRRLSVLDDMYAFDFASRTWSKLGPTAASASSPGILQSMFSMWPLARAYAGLARTPTGLLLVGGEQGSDAPANPALAGLPFSLLPSSPSGGARKISDTLLMPLPACSLPDLSGQLASYPGIATLSCASDDYVCTFTCADGYFPAAESLASAASSQPLVSVCGLDGSWSVPSPFCLPALDPTATVTVTGTGAGEADVDVQLPASIKNAVAAGESGVWLRVRGIDAGLPLECTAAVIGGSCDGQWSHFDSFSGPRTDALLGAHAPSNASSLAQWSQLTNDAAYASTFGGGLHLGVGRLGRNSWARALPTALAAAAANNGASWAVETHVHETDTGSLIALNIFDASDPLTLPNNDTVSDVSAPARSPKLSLQLTHPSSRARFEMHWIMPGSYPSSSTWCNDIWAGWSMRGAPPSTTEPYPDAPPFNLQAMYLRWERNGTAMTWQALYKQRPEAMWQPLCPPINDTQLHGGGIVSPLVGLSVSAGSSSAAVSAIATFEYVAILPLGSPDGSGSVIRYDVAPQPGAGPYGGGFGVGYPTLARPSGDGVSDRIQLTPLGVAGGPITVKVKGIRGGTAYPRIFVAEVASCGRASADQQPLHWVPLRVSDTSAAIADAPQPIPLPPPVNLLGLPGTTTTATVMAPPFTSQASFPLLYDGVTAPGPGPSGEDTQCIVFRDPARPPLMDLHFQPGFFGRISGVNVWPTGSSVNTSSVWQPNVYHVVAGPRSEPNGWEANGECRPPPYPTMDWSAPSAMVPCDLRARHVRMRPRNQNSYRGVTMQLCEYWVMGIGTCYDRPAATASLPNTQYAAGTTSANCTSAPWGYKCNMECAPGFTQVAGSLSSTCTSPPYWSQPAPVCAPTCASLTLPAGSGGTCFTTVFRDSFDGAETGSIPATRLLSRWSQAISWHDPVAEGHGPWSVTNNGTARVIVGVGSPVPSSDYASSAAGKTLYFPTTATDQKLSSGLGGDIAFVVRLRTGRSAGLLIRGASDDEHILVTVSPTGGTVDVIAASSIDNDFGNTVQRRLLLASAVLPPSSSCAQAGAWCALSVVDSETQRSIMVFVDGVLLLTVPVAMLEAQGSTGVNWSPVADGSRAAIYADAGETEFDFVEVRRPCSANDQVPTVTDAVPGQAFHIVCLPGYVMRGPATRLCEADSAASAAAWSAAPSDWGCVPAPELQYPRAGDAARPLRLRGIAGLAHATAISASIGGNDCPIVTSASSPLGDAFAAAISLRAASALSANTSLLDIYCAVPAGQGDAEVVIVVNASGYSQSIHPATESQPGRWISGVGDEVSLLNLIAALPGADLTTRAPMLVSFARGELYEVQQLIDGLWDSYNVTSASRPAVLRGGVATRLIGTSLGTAPQVTISLPPQWATPLSTSLTDLGESYTITGITACAGTGLGLDRCVEFTFPAGDGDASSAQYPACPDGWYSPPGSTVCYSLQSGTGSISSTPESICASIHPSASAAAFHNPTEADYVIRGMCGWARPSGRLYGLGLGPSGPPRNGYSQNWFYTGLTDEFRDTKSRDCCWTFGNTNTSNSFVLSTPALWCPGEPNQLTGENYGTVNIQAQPNLACLNDYSRPSSANQLMCCEVPRAPIPASDAGYLLQLKAGNRYSDPVHFVYPSPQLAAVAAGNLTAASDGASGPVTGGFPVTMTGSFFGGPNSLSHPAAASVIFVVVGQAAATSIGGSAILAAAAAGSLQLNDQEQTAAGLWVDPSDSSSVFSWVHMRNVTRINDTTITAIAPPGVGQSLPIRVFISGQGSNVIHGLSYYAPAFNISGMRSTAGTLPNTSSVLSPLGDTTTAGGSVYLLTSTDTIRRPNGVLATSNETTISVAGSGFGASPLQIATEHNWYLQAAARSGLIVNASTAPPPSCVYVTWWKAPLRHNSSSCVCNGAEDWLGEGEIAQSSIGTWRDDLITFRVPHLSGLRVLDVCIGGQGLRVNISTVEPAGSGNVSVFVVPLLPVLDSVVRDVDGNDAGNGPDAVTVRGKFWPPLLPSLDLVPTVDADSNRFTSPLNTSLAFALPLGRLELKVGSKCFLPSSLNDAMTKLRIGDALLTPLLSGCAQSVTMLDYGVASLAVTGSTLRRNVTVAVVDEPLVLPSVRAIELPPQPPKITGIRPNPLLLSPSDVLVLSASTSGAVQNIDGFGWSTGGGQSATIIDILGSNLPTDDASASSIGAVAYIDGVRCTNTTRRSEGSLSFLSCIVPAAALTVGAKNVSVAFDGGVGQTVSLPSTSAAALVVGCGVGLFGFDGESCIACPRGADCRGYDSVRRVHTYPQAQAGWYDLLQDSRDAVSNANGTDPLAFTDKLACPPGIQQSGRMVCMAPCEPAESCVGGNECGTGYASIAPHYRCGSCQQGYHRLGSFCVFCPDAALVRFVFVMMALFGGCALAFLLSQRGTALPSAGGVVSVLSSGMDGFQVLATIGSLRLNWPAEVRGILSSLSAFNLNVELIAPECILPNSGLAGRVASAMALPIVLVLVFTLLHIGLLGVKALKGSRIDKGKLLHSAPSLLNMCFSLLSFAYLFVCLATAAAVDCIPTSPPDGRTYIRGSLEPCGQGGPLQSKLAEAALASLILYVIGIPAVIAAILLHNRHAVTEDQLLRAYGTGATRLTNPRAYTLRRTAGSLYSRFVPRHALWQLWLLGRKASIAALCLWFNDNPSAQAASLLVVLVAALVAQVACLPLIGVDNRLAVIRTHLTAIGYGSVRAGQGAPGSDTALRAALVDVESRVRARLKRMDGAGPHDDWGIVGRGRKSTAPSAGDKLDLTAWDQLASSSAGVAGTGGMCGAFSWPVDPYGHRTWMWAWHVWQSPNAVETLMTGVTLLVAVIALLCETTDSQPEYASARSGLASCLVAALSIALLYWGAALAFHSVAPDPLLDQAAYKRGLTWDSICSRQPGQTIVENDRGASGGAGNDAVDVDAESANAGTGGLKRTSSAFNTHNPLTEPAAGISKLSFEPSSLSAASALQTDRNHQLLLRSAQESVSERVASAAPPTSAEWQSLRASTTLLIEELHRLQSQVASSALAAGHSQAAAVVARGAGSKAAPVSGMQPSVADHTHSTFSPLHPTSAAVGAAGRAGDARSGATGRTPGNPRTSGI